MASSFGEDGLTRLGVAGALAREYAADEKAFLPFLAEALSKAFGNAVEQRIKGGFLSKKVLQGITLTSGDARYTLEVSDNGALRASVTHVVRGIALKTEALKVEDWLVIVSEIAEQTAAEHAATRKALLDLLGLS
jgi:hypothetical protein